MIWVLSWRNIWRNKRRSAIIIIAIALGLFAGVFTLALSNGMIKQRIETIIATELAHIQIHQKGFTDNYDFFLSISGADEITKSIKDNNPRIKAISRRMVTNSMVTSSETGTGVKIIGIIPHQEKGVSDIHEKIIEGSYFDSKKKNQVVIGRKLADKLKVKLGKKIVVTLLDVNKMITYAAFKVVGIYKTDNALFDEGNVYVRYDDFCKVTGLGNTSAHEIAVLMEREEDVLDAAERIKKLHASYLVETWLDISPEASYMVDAANQYLYVFIIIILLALCFGIINTMLMAVLERTHELGMLMAVGMSGKRIFVMIMFETVFLTLTGGLIGLLGSYGLMNYLSDIGIDLYFWKEAFEWIGYSSIVYPYIDLVSYFIIAVMVIILGVLSAVYPAVKALKLKPVEALRIE